MSEFKFQCLVCGQNIVCTADHAGAKVACPNCKNTITVPRGFDDPAIPEPPPSTPPPLPPAPPATSTKGAQRTSRLAIAAFVCSLSSLATCIGWLPGIICGHLARSRIRRNPSLRGSDVALAGLIIGYAMLILTVTAGVGALIFRTAIKQMYQPAQQAQQATSAKSSTPGDNPFLPTVADTNEAASAVPLVETNQPGWTLDVMAAPFPDQPVSGTLHGADFTGKRILWRNGDLKINSTVAGASLTIHGLGATLANRSYEFQPAADTNAPAVEITWSDGGESQSETFSNGYALKLQFAKAVKRKVRAQIYLCLPDDDKSYVAGTFVVTLPKRKPQ